MAGQRGEVRVGVEDRHALAEGDGSYDVWRAVHLEYFGELCAARGERFDPAHTPVVLERFEVLASWLVEGPGARRA